ncbi:MAG: hypothetical protein WB611_14430 [Stellaceae bacterium]
MPDSSPEADPARQARIFDFSAATQTSVFGHLTPGPLGTAVCFDALCADYADRLNALAGDDLDRKQIEH